MEYNREYFKGKTAAVTGGASGVGNALCEELLLSGVTALTILDFNPENLAAQTTRLTEQYPGNVQGILCDVRVETEVKASLDKAASFGKGRLDLLINCAGAAFACKFTEEPGGIVPGHPFLSEVGDNTSWKNAFALNFYGALYGCRAAIPKMIEQGGGQIVNIISGIAFAPMAYQSQYGATKAALLALSLSLRAEYAHYGILISAATPGTTATAIFKSADVPPDAQSPTQSATRILKGITQNTRLILGDDEDTSGAITNFGPDGVARSLDQVFSSLARSRKEGNTSFTGYDEPVVSEADQPSITFINALKTATDDEIIVKKTDAYLKTREKTVFCPDTYKGKNAVVTGGASGIGLALCETLLDCGAKKVVLADINEKNLTEQTNRLEALYPGKVSGFITDTSDEASVKHLIQTASDSFDGTFDLLVNCAGLGRMGLFTETPDTQTMIKNNSWLTVETQASWERLFAVNFYGPLYGCRAALPIMVRQGSGKIVNIFSGTAFLGEPFQSVYCATKAALNLFTLCLRYEYFDTGVQICSASPGLVNTPIHAGMLTGGGNLTPREAAEGILAGAANNDRVIMPDPMEHATAIYAYHPVMGAGLDHFVNATADKRRTGSAVQY